jgi:prepilin-type processing-associated H-X9-DG protein
MSPRVARPATAAALAVALGLACLPACKKKARPTEPDTPNPAPNTGGPPPGPGPSTAGGRDPAAPPSPVFRSAAEAPMRAAARNDLMQIMLALHSFHDTNNGLPAGFADKTGKPGLSWRVAVLPFLEQPGLFQQFKLDEPWDSEHNKALIGKMPAVFAPPRTSTNGYTFYRGFSGPNTWLPPLQQSARPGQALLGVRLTNITDGTSNTILVAEAYEPVIWTKPEEVAFDPNNPPKLGGVFSSGFNVGMADGSVRFLRNGISPKTLAAAIGINDGNIVNLDD